MTRDVPSPDYIRIHDGGLYLSWGRTCSLFIGASGTVSCGRFDKSSVKLEEFIKLLAAIKQPEAQ